MSDHDDDATCPLCMDPLDATDKAISYCPCSYRMCLWCWNQLMETASRESLPGRCPNCRKEYDKDKITMSQLDPDLLHKEQQQRRKDAKKKQQPQQQQQQPQHHQHQHQPQHHPHQQQHHHHHQLQHQQPDAHGGGGGGAGAGAHGAHGAAAAAHRPPKGLGQVRVVQRNLVYAVGMPLSICREETLADRHYFGQFGRIKKVSVNRSTPFSQVQKNGPSGSAYVTYCRPEDALRCIEAVDGAVWEGKTIKACFGTTKYCNAFLKGVPCNNPDCLYLHDIAEPGDSFSKEDMMANGLASGRSAFFDMVHPTNTKEAAAHAHAAISGGKGGGGGAAAAAAAPAAASAAAAGPGPAPAGAGPRPPAAQPVAITGAQRTSGSAPWGSSGGGGSDGGGPATASPARPGAAAMAAAAAARWGAAPKPAAQAPAAPLTSPLADMEWPSLGAAQDGAADGKPGSIAAAEPGHHQHAAGGAATSSRTAAAVLGGAHQHASALHHPVSHPVGQGGGVAPTAAAVVAGKVAVSAAKQQGKQPQQLQRTMAHLTKPGKAASVAAAAPKADPVQPGKGKAAKGAAEGGAQQQQQQQQQQQANSSKEADGSGKAAPQANGKLSKLEAKRAAKEAAKEAKVAAKAAAAAAAAGAAGEAASAAALPLAESSGRAEEQAPAPLPAPALATPPMAPPPAAGTPPKVPPPGFAGRAKGPPPGFSGLVPPQVQRPQAAGLEPSLLALARASSGSSLAQVPLGAGSTTSGPVATARGPSPLAAAAANGSGGQRSSDGGGSGSGAGPLADNAGPGLSHGPPLAARQHHQQLFGAVPAPAAPSFPAPPQPPLFAASPGAAGGAPGAGFDLNAFFEGAGRYSAPADAAGSASGGGLFGAPVGRDALEGAAAAPAARGVPGNSSRDAAVPLSTRKQSRWGFAQQPQLDPEPAPVAEQPAPPQAPPGFPSAGAAGGGGAGAALAPPSASPLGAGFVAAGAYGGTAAATPVFAAQNATSFFKHLLPGVNVHVAASPPSAAPVPPPHTVAGLAAPGGHAGMQGTPPNPGLALLQQLQRGTQQHH